MSKSVQILLAVAAIGAGLVGFLLSELLGPGGPPPARDLRATAAGNLGSIMWPLPPPGPDRTEMDLRGRQVFMQKKCWECHKLGADPLPGPLNVLSQGPDLDVVGRQLSIDRIIESIVNPNAVIAQPADQYTADGVSKMPSQIDNLSVGDLMRLAVFLSDRNQPTAQPPAGLSTYPDLSPSTGARPAPTAPGAPGAPSTAPTTPAALPGSPGATPGTPGVAPTTPGVAPGAPGLAPTTPGVFLPPPGTTAPPASTPSTGTPGMPATPGTIYTPATPAPPAPPPTTPTPPTPTRPAGAAAAPAQPGAATTPTQP
ncbi:MAG: c-type cytochrome [Planctomycetota bacterium]